MYRLELTILQGRQVILMKRWQIKNVHFRKSDKVSMETVYLAVRRSTFQSKWLSAELCLKYKLLKKTFMTRHVRLQSGCSTLKWIFGITVKSRSSFCAGGVQRCLCKAFFLYGTRQQLQSSEQCNSGWGAKRTLPQHAVGAHPACVPARLPAGGGGTRGGGRRCRRDSGRPLPVTSGSKPRWAAFTGEIGR